MEENVIEKQKKDHERWRLEINAAERELKKFYDRAESVNKRYLDERDLTTSNQKWFNLFFANTNILASALYAQLPKPDVSRRFKDYDDDLGRVAGIILQRCITQDLDDPRDTFDATLRHCVQDRLVPGLAQAWLRLETTTEEIKEVLPETQPGTEAEAEQEPMYRITDQRVCVDYVYWKDFIWSPCRVWEERRWVGRKVFMDHPALVKRFGDKLGNQIPLDYSPNRVSDGAGSSSTPQDDTIKKAVIYELWVREGRKVIWVSKGLPQILDEKDDPLGLVGFEPCPKPLLANITTSNTVPRPDYYMLQDQYNELDTVNQRISKLVQACKVVGVYDKGSPGVQRMLSEGTDNQLIPVDNWAMFAEKGGIKGQIDWLPLEQVVNALQQLNMAREAIKAQIYELSGIADIVRGASKASETLGAQEIKAKFASIRIKKLQDDVANFAAEILRIKAEIKCRHFEPEILLQESNILSTPDADMAGPAIELLKNPDTFEWRITVTADSIAQADYDMEKQDRTNFLTAVSGYLEKAGAMVQTQPEVAPLLVGLLKWAVAGYKGANEIEGMLDQTLDSLNKEPLPPKEDPEKAKADAEMQKQQSEDAREQQRLQMEQMMQERQMQMDERLRQAELAMEERRNEMQIELQRTLGELKVWLETTLANIKIGAANQQANLKQQEHIQQSEMRQVEHEQSMGQQQEAAAVTIANKMAEARAGTPKE